MLIEFSVTNFRSIKERQTLSMLSSDRVKSEDRRNALFPISQYKNLDLLTCAAIYGKNSAGKSNIIKAFKAIEWLVLHSHSFTRGNRLEANETFQFSTDFAQIPTLFEIDFLAKDGKRYLYTIEFNKEEILREELHYFAVTSTGKTTKRKLYIRLAHQPISYGDDFKGLRKPIEERTLQNVLFLSKSISENNSFLGSVFDFFQTGFRISDFSEGYNDIQTKFFAKLASEKSSLDMKILNDALVSIDTGILELTSARLEELPPNFRFKDISEDELSDEEKKKRDELIDTLKTEMRAVHRLFDGIAEIGTKSIPLKEESEGTQKFIAVFSTLIQLLKSGTLMVVDEFDKSFHPHLTQTLISLLANPNVNKNGAQLIFTTHDNTLLDILDNDQINLVQKDFMGATEIYTVSDIRGLRGDVANSKRYLRGELEAVPNINKSSLYQSLELEYE